MAIEINGTTGISGVNGSATTPALQGQDTNTGISFGTDEVNVVTGGTTRTTVDSGGRLLIGTSSDVSQGSSNTSIQVRGASNNLTGELWLARNETSTTADGNEVGKIAWSARDPSVAAWRHTAYIISDVDGTPGNSQMPGRIEFHTNSGSFAGAPTERLRITSDGTLQLRNSPGIDFSQIQTNNANMTSETLDSYEEGTWTPTLGNNGYTYTYDTQDGEYTKIGRQVTCRFRVVVTARSGSPSSGHTVITLPFSTNGSLDDGYWAWASPHESIWYKSGSSTSTGTKVALPLGFGNSATAYCWINNPTTTGSGWYDLGTDFHIGGVFTYFAAS